MVAGAPAAGPGLAATTSGSQARRPVSGFTVDAVLQRNLAAHGQESRRRCPGLRGPRGHLRAAGRPRHRARERAAGSRVPAWGRVVRPRIQPGRVVRTALRAGEGRRRARPGQLPAETQGDRLHHRGLRDPVARRRGCSSGRRSAAVRVEVDRELRVLSLGSRPRPALLPTRRCAVHPDHRRRLCSVRTTCCCCSTRPGPRGSPRARCTPRDGALELHPPDPRLRRSPGTTSISSFRPCAGRRASTASPWPCCGPAAGLSSTRAVASAQSPSAPPSRSTGVTKTILVPAVLRRILGYAGLERPRPLVPQPCPQRRRTGPDPADRGVAPPGAILRARPGVRHGRVPDPHAAAGGPRRGAQGRSRR